MRYGPRGPGKKARAQLVKAGWDSGLWNAAHKKIRKGRSRCECCNPTRRTERRRLKQQLREEI